MNQLTPQEAQGALQFLNRVDLKGAEAEAMAVIKMKIGQIINPPAEAVPGNVTDLQGLTGEGSAKA